VLGSPIARVHSAGAITRDALAALDLDGVERLLVNTRSQPGPTWFADPFAYLEPAAAELLAELGIVLFGIAVSRSMTGRARTCRPTTRWIASYPRRTWTSSIRLAVAGSTLRAFRFMARRTL
jgi:hypothetical protein